MSGVNFNPKETTGASNLGNSPKINETQKLITCVAKKALPFQAVGSPLVINLGGGGSRELIDQFFSRSEMSDMRTFPVFTEILGGKINEDTLNIIFLHLNLKSEIYGDIIGKSVVEAITSEIPNYHAFKNKDEEFDSKNINVLNFHEFMNKIEGDEKFEVSISDTEKVPLKSLKKLPETETAKKLKANIEELVEIAQKAANLSNVNKKPGENKATATGTAPSLSSSTHLTGEVKRKKQEMGSSENRGTKKSEGSTTQSEMKANAETAQENVDKRQAVKQLDEKLLSKKRKAEQADMVYTEQVVKKQKLD